MKKKVLFLSYKQRVIRVAKRFVFIIICVKAINLLLRILLKPVSPFIPGKIINRIPIVGEVYLQLPNSKTVVITSDGSDSLASTLFWSGLSGFEPETMDLYFRLLKYSKTVFDIGANTGLFALFAAIDCRSRDVYAFEPVPRIFDYLVKNVKINGLHNLKLVQGAVTNHDGEIFLYIPYSVTLPFSASTLKGFRKQNETIVVPALSIDTFVAANNISKIDLLKIDTEGTEHKVLEGAKNILERDRPIIICEVLNGLTEKTLQHIFDRTEYAYFLITRRGLIRKEKITGDATYINRNYLFITENRIPEVLQGVNLS